MSQKVVTQTLAAAVATSGTFTVTYPAGTNASWFKYGKVHTISALGGTFRSPEDFGITSFGNLTATITWRNSVTLPAGTTLRIGLDAPGGNWLDENSDPVPGNVSRISRLHNRRISLGAPVAADVDGISTALPTSGNATINGTTLVGTKAVLDVPRNVTISPPASFSFMGATVTGKDVYGATVIETLAANGGAGTTVSGVKAFKEVTSISIVTCTATGATGTIGFGDVLGLPVYLESSAFVRAELQDGATAVAGTITAGLATNTASTATTADVRGTYDPNAACDGSKVFELLVQLSDPSFKGVPQYDG